MGCIKITLTDHESGNVKIEVEPDFDKLLAIAKSGKITPAESYAMVALRHIVQMSVEATMKAKGIEGAPRIRMQ